MKSNRINKILANHSQEVGQLFNIYGIEMPVTAQNVADAMYILGDDFSQLFWSLDKKSNVGFTGLRSLFGGAKEEEKPDPEVEKSKQRFIAFCTVGVSLIVILLLLNFAFRE